MTQRSTKTTETTVTPRHRLFKDFTLPLCSPYSLSGIIHVMYAALNQYLSAYRPGSGAVSDSPDDETGGTEEECGVRLSSNITEDEANMAVVLTEYFQEYFQEQRKVYEKVTKS